MGISIIYRNIYIYRILMNILYRMKYLTRFHDIIDLMKPSDKTVLDLCFGDVLLKK